MLYFIQTTRFIPINYKKYGFKVIDENTLLLESDNSIWKKIKLYDLGWGQEDGYYRTPMLSKEELFLLAFPEFFKNDFDERFNYWGSISVLLDKYCNYLLEEINKKLLSDNNFLKKYEHVIIYINSELGLSDDIINKISNKSLIDNCKKWRKIKKDFGILL